MEPYRNWHQIPLFVSSSGYVIGSPGNLAAPGPVYPRPQYYSLGHGSSDAGNVAGINGLACI